MRGPPLMAVTLFWLRSRLWPSPLSLAWLAAACAEIVTRNTPRPSCRSQVSVTSCDVGPEFGGGADVGVKKLPAWLQVSGFPEFHQHRRGLGWCLEPGLSSVSTRGPRGADIGHWIVDSGQGSAGHDTISCVEHPGQGHLHTSCAHAHAPSPWSPQSLVYIFGRKNIYSQSKYLQRRDVHEEAAARGGDGGAAPAHAAHQRGQRGL